MELFGIDISRWQGNFDLAAAVKEGVKYVIIKGGGGDDGLYVDSRFQHFYDEAKKLGLPVGVYWFSKATTMEDAVAEAQFFYSNVLKGRQFDLPVFMDVEHADMLDLGKRLLTDIIKKWCSHLEDMDYWVGVYSTVYAFYEYMYDDELQRYTHWVAQWASQCTYGHKEVLGFWQFGGETNLKRSNKIAGVVCDQNYMYGDFPRVIKELELNGYAPQPEDDEEPPVTYPKTTEQLAEEVIAGMWGVGTNRRLRLEDAGYNYEEVQKLVDIIMEARDAERSTVKAGDMVYMKPEAPVYGSKKKFAAFVYNSLLYVRELDKKRAVISVFAEGPVTGAVNVKYLVKYNP